MAQKKKDIKRKKSPQQMRQEAHRKERLKMIQDQVKEGTLTVRKMTKKEMAANPPQSPGQTPNGPRHPRRRAPRKTKA